MKNIELIRKLDVNGDECYHIRIGGKFIRRFEIHAEADDYYNKCVETARYNRAGETVLKSYEIKD